MNLVGEQILLRIYLQSADRTPLEPTYARLVKAARTNHLAGATVFRGILGYGSHGTIKVGGWHWVEHAPIIVETVDSAEKIRAFIQGPMDDLVTGGVVATLERANVMMYRHRAHDQPVNLSLGAAQIGLSALPQIQTRAHMTTNEKGVLLRIFIGESDKSTDGKPLHESIVQKARELNIAGATVLRGVEGFGAHSVLHKAHLLEMSVDLPIVIEIVDSEEKINALLPHVQDLVREGMMTTERVTILAYSAGGEKPPLKP